MSHERKLLSSLILLLLLHFCTATNIITSGQSLKDGDLLVSSNENFALGFFSPGKSSNRYVGIWYNKVSEQTVVWVANRDNPISNTTGVFSLDTAGNLVIHGSDRNIPVWSTNVSATAVAKPYSAQLLDSGNLVVFHGDSKTVVVWQSFDYLTDTLLPYMKIGVHRQTGLNWFLTSWKSRDDPGTGAYSFKIDLTGWPELFLYKGSTPLWRTGPWIGPGLSGVPQMSSNFFIFTVIYVENQDEVYWMDELNDPSIFSRMVVNESGSLERLTWHGIDHRWVVYLSAPKEQCDYYVHCGAYGNCHPYITSEFECTCLPGFEPKLARDWYLRDGSGGCVRKRGVQTCQNGEGFVKVAHAKVPDTSTARVNKSMGLQACEEECLKNCSCKGYASANISQGGTGCVTWHGELMDIREFSSGGQDLYIRVDAVELAASRRKNSQGRKRMLVIIAVSVVFGVLLVLSCSYYLWRKYAKITGERENRSYRQAVLFGSAINRDTSNANIDEQSRATESTFFDLATVTAATENFSPAKKLGQGGFGPVYKGELSNGQQIAVKRLSKNSGQGIVEFKTEALLIAKLQHRNLVRLLGCCIEDEERMLIYEFMPNKSLDYFLFDENRKSMLDWKKRHEIIVGVARGILYLHQDSRLRIIHRDLKASNILLDEEFNPKISDFGTARIVGGNQSQANTNRVVGTFGYMSPEYALDGLFSIKSDVFSFGVLLLEVISGKKNIDFFHYESNLIENVWELWSGDRASEIIDSSMADSCSTHEVMRCVQVGLLCVQDSATDRPTMSAVVFMLSNEAELPSPREPTFFIRRNDRNDKWNTGTKSSSINEVTVTQFDPR